LPAHQQHRWKFKLNQLQRRNFRKMTRASGVNRPWPAQAPHVREVVCFDQGDHHLLSRRVVKSSTMQLHIRIGVVKIAQKSIRAKSMRVRMGGAALPFSDDVSEAEMTH
jgi:hypothetical protein